MPATPQECCLAFNTVRHDYGIQKTVLVDQDRSVWIIIATRLNQEELRPEPAMRAFFHGMQYTEVLAISPKHIISAFSRIKANYGGMANIRSSSHYRVRYYLQCHQVQEWSKRWHRSVVDIVADPYTMLDCWFRAMYLTMLKQSVSKAYADAAMAEFNIDKGLQDFITGECHGTVDDMGAEFFQPTAGPSLRQRVPAAVAAAPLS